MSAEVQKTPPVSKQKFWQQHIQDCSRSTFSQTQYCLTHGLALSTFSYWKRKLSKSRKDSPRFYPLTVQPVLPHKTHSVGSGLTLHRGKFRIDLSENFSTTSLKNLLVTIEQL